MQPHRFQFFRAGGVDQAGLRDGADLLHLVDLDQKLWGALACPARGLEIDARTLELLDTDRDGRLRAPELLAAVRWLAEVHADPDAVMRGDASLPLASIRGDTEPGAALAAAA